MKKQLTWVKKAGKNASQGTFDDAAAFGDLLFLCLNGEYALDAVKSIAIRSC